MTTDILLIETPTSNDMERKVDVAPLGIGYIAAVAEQNGFKAEILDLNIEINRIEKKIKNADLIGVSCYTQNYPSALEILKKAKTLEKKVVVGGPHVTALYEPVLRDGFDYVVRGEGEYPILDLLKGEKFPKGTAVLQSGVASTNSVSRVKDLDSLPLPSRHLLKLEKYSFPGAISTTRGCASHCIFCSSRALSGFLRARSVGSLENELTNLQEIGIDSFFVTDPNFAYDKKRALDFFKIAGERDMNWYSELRLDHIDAEIISGMGESGCRVVRFGIESGSQRVIDTIKKGISLSRLKKVITAFKSKGIIPVCGFMIGHPTETPEDFKKTIKLAKHIIDLGGHVTFSILTPYPGTYIYNNSEKLGLKILSRKWEEYTHLNPVIETENFSRENLKEMLFNALLEISGESNKKDAGFPDGMIRKSFRSICMETA